MSVEVGRINKEEKVIVSSLDLVDKFTTKNKNGDIVHKTHKRIMQDIRELECSEDFRQHHFVLTKYKDSQNKTQPMYLMDRDGFTILAMGYTGKEAMKYKEDYINQFNTMERMLQSKSLEREKGIAVRQALTKALQQSNENERMHGHAYSNYTNCIYKLLFNKNASQMRKELGLDKKANVRDYLDEEDLKAVKSMEMLVSGLIDCGWGYDKIKDFIQQTNTKLIAN